MLSPSLTVTLVFGFLCLSCLSQSPSSHTHTLAVRLMDAVVYFWMPQIACIFLRLVQGRNILHRMVGRTVVIGDIPWVAQAGEAFLSKVSSFMRFVDMDIVSVDSMRRKIGVRSLSLSHSHSHSCHTHTLKSYSYIYPSIHLLHRYLPVRIVLPA